MELSLREFSNACNDCTALFPPFAFFFLVLVGPLQEEMCSVAKGFHSSIEENKIGAIVVLFLFFSRCLSFAWHRTSGLLVLTIVCSFLRVPPNFAIVPCSLRYVVGFALPSTCSCSSSHECSCLSSTCCYSFLLLFFSCFRRKVARM